ncbi:MAG: tetratricopeptide repeat protein [Armatimonadetes bacterium]|nr:tetratricopeptide repeat protein [Armatimonadota bacterium]
MADTALNHYETLGIAPDADDADIKRAWARKVREHPPEKDPEASQRINEAKRVLLDPKARARYDSHLQHGEEIAGLILEALIAGAAEDHAAAAAAFRRAVALAPDDDETRNMWALATKRAGDVPGSVRILRGLVQRAPDVGLYRYNVGTMLWELEEPDDALTESLRHLKEAVSLEPHNSDYHIGLARCYMRLQRFGEAEQAIESALLTDGEVNVQDLEALFELPVIHIFADRLGQIKHDAERIRAVVADLDEDAHEHCGYRFGQLAVDLIKAKAFKPAQHCARAAVQCAPANAKLKELRTAANSLCKIEAELAKLTDDPVVPAAIKGGLATWGFMELDTMSEEEAQEHYNEVLSALGHLPPSTIVTALDYAKITYPALYKLGREDFEHWRQIASRHQSPDRTQARPQPTNSVPQQNSGGCVLPTTLLALAIVMVVLLLAKL